MTVKKKTIKTETIRNIRHTGTGPRKKRETTPTPTGKTRNMLSVGKIKSGTASSRDPSGKPPLRKKTAETSVSKNKNPVRVITPQPVKRKMAQKPQKKMPRVIGLEEETIPAAALPPPVPEQDEIQSDNDEEWPEIGKKDSLKSYMENISRYPLIGIEDEVRLAEMIHSADPEQKKQAAQTLIQSNLRLVVKIAHDFKGIGLPLMDLISEGNIGLMRSVYKFDPALGAKFSSYAAWWIKQSMHRALSNQTRTIRIPVQTGAKIRKIRLTREKLAAELGREPLDTELAAELNYSKRTVNMLRHAESSTFSLNDPIKSGENDTFEELIADPNAKSPEKQVSDADSLQRLHVAMTLLDDREREVITLRFFRFKTLEQVSVMIHRTRERVRQIQNQALAKMRVVMQEEAEVVNS